MSDLQAYWNKSSATIPDDKDPSAYAIEKEQVFPKPAIVCDLGGGSGADSLYFASKGHRVDLVDISNIALARASEAAKKKGFADKVKVYQADLGEGALPLATARFDVVYSRLALHYFKSDILQKLLTEIYKLLKPNGTAYITVKSPDDKAEMDYLVKQSVEVEDGVFDEGGYIKTRYSLQQLKDILSKAGIPSSETSVDKYTEDLGGRKDKVKSGNTQLTVNQITLHKPAA